MDVALSICALLMALLGVIGAVVTVIPGAALSFLALLFNYFTDEPIVTTTELLIWLAVVVAVSVADSVLPVYLTKRLGGSKSGVWGATIGMVVGFIAFPPLGIIFCPIFGAIMGELINDKENVNRAIKVGLASFLAFLVGTAIKFILSIYILSLIITSQMAWITDLIERIKGVI
ncbi:MAG: DUF456 domain-containing protein [Rikenellaceae bacterium]